VQLGLHNPSCRRLRDSLDWCSVFHPSFPHLQMTAAAPYALFHVPYVVRGSNISATTLGDPFLTYISNGMISQSA